jgi:hypothetical protein
MRRHMKLKRNQPKQFDVWRLTEALKRFRNWMPCKECGVPVNPDAHWAMYRDPETGKEAPVKLLDLHEECLDTLRDRVTTSWTA